jgi:hypothetical protein
MTSFQQIPIFSDVARRFDYPVVQSPLDYCQILLPGGTAIGSVTMKPQYYTVVWGITVFTNYDNVAPVLATANSNAILGRPFVPNNFTVKLDRGNSNKYSNQPIPQAQICSAGYRAGKVFPYPVVYGPRSNIQFTFQDTTGLFLLTATSEGTAVPMKIQMFLLTHVVPIPDWDMFVSIYPCLAAIYGSAPSL